MFSPRLLQKGTSVFAQIECFSLSAHTQVVVDKTLSLKFIIIKKIINMYRAWFFVFNLSFVLHRVFQKTGKKSWKKPFLFIFLCKTHSYKAVVLFSSTLKLRTYGKLERDLTFVVQLVFSRHVACHISRVHRLAHSKTTRILP